MDGEKKKRVDELACVCACVCVYVSVCVCIKAVVEEKQTRSTSARGAMAHRCFVCKEQGVVHLHQCEARGRRGSAVLHRAPAQGESEKDRQGTRGTHGKERNAIKSHRKHERASASNTDPGMSSTTTHAPIHQRTCETSDDADADANCCCFCCWCWCCWSAACGTSNRCSPTTRSRRHENPKPCAENMTTRVLGVCGATGMRK